MGQRLNIEIINNGKTLANAYYHWSAYSGSAAKMARDVIKNIDMIDEENELFKAIKLLYLTGAGFNEIELSRAREVEGLTGLELESCTNRNKGLLSVSKEGINETRFWQEYALYIYLDEKRMNYKVFYNQERWDYERDVKECGDEEDYPKFDDMEIFDINFDDVKFDSIDEFVGFVQQNKFDRIRTCIEPNKVFSFIE